MTGSGRDCFARQHRRDFRRGDFQARPHPRRGPRRHCHGYPYSDQHFVLLDSGANIECKPVHLAHYAVMGSIYAREVLGYKNPRVGILSIGTEDSKGNELTLEAFRLCKQIDINSSATSRATTCSRAAWTWSCATASLATSS